MGSRNQTAIEFVSEARRLLQLDCFEEAIIVLNSLLADFFTNSAADREVATALGLKGFALATLGRPEHAGPVYDQLISHFGGTTDPIIFAQVGSALLSKGESLSLCGRWDEALLAYATLFTDFASPSHILTVGTLNTGAVNETAGIVALMNSQDA